MILFQQLEHMYKLAVWDNHGRMYMPVYSDNEVVAYARTGEALHACTYDHAKEIISNGKG